MKHTFGQIVSQHFFWHNRKYIVKHFFSPILENDSMKSFYRVLCCALLMGSASAAPGAWEGVWKGGEGGGGCTLQKEYKQGGRREFMWNWDMLSDQQRVRGKLRQASSHIYINFEHFWTHNRSFAPSLSCSTQINRLLLSPPLRAKSEFLIPPPVFFPHIYLP